VDPSLTPVLFVEDSPDAMLVYKSYLKGSGFQAISALTTREAEDVIERIPPRVIVLDIILRSEDTWQFLARLKEEPRTKHIPVIVASTIEDQSKGFKLGATAYLVKPVERSALLAELRRLTGESALGRVLMIDDNELDRYLLKQHLKNLPFGITEASNGADGIRKAIEAVPDAIFLDLAMPEMSGFEVIERLKAAPATRRIPVIIVTSRSLTDLERRKLKEGGAAAILSKHNLAGTVVEDALRRILD
jgi:CheY-like chemotaxis protein